MFFLFVVLPVFYVFGDTVLNWASLYNNIATFDLRNLEILLKSILIASIVGFISTVLGIIIGFLLYKTNMRGRNFFKLVLLLPLFIAPYIWAVAWKDLFYLIFNNTNFIYSVSGMILVLTTVFTPLSVLIIGSALANIDSAMEESGLVITKFGRVVVKIILPLIKPAIFTSFVLVFIFSISEFSVPAFLGVEVFTTEIFKQFSAFYNHSLAVFQSLLLVVICIVLLVTERKYISGSPFLSIGSKGTTSKVYQLQSKNKYGYLFIGFWFVASILLPLIILFFQAFRNGIGNLEKAFVLLLPTFFTSFILALSGAALIVVIGFVVAWFTFRNPGTEMKKIFDWTLLIVFAIPSIIFGISLIKFYNRPAFNFINTGFTIIVIGYAGKFSFISYKVIENSFKQIPKSFLEVASLEGIKPLSQLWNIIFPSVLPAVLASFVIGFVFSLEELGMTIMLYPPGSEIMPIKVFTIMANAPQSLTSSMTLIVFSITLFLIIIFYLIVNKFLKSYYLPE